MIQIYILKTSDTFLVVNGAHASEMSNEFHSRL
jgi:hypothetical protein